MQAIEFKSVVQNQTIDLPKAMPFWEGKKVRVIVLLEEVLDPVVAHQPASFEAARLETQAFKFDRDEANAR